MFDTLVGELSDRYGLGDRGRDLFGLLMGYIHNDHRGGFGGFVEAFREQGHGELFSSWLGNPDGGNGLNASDVGMVFGQGLLNDWGNRLGVSRATVAAAIAGVLPRLVAELTPGGRVPGGFAPVTPHADAGSVERTATRATEQAPHRDAAPGFSTQADEDRAITAGHATARDLGSVVPGEERGYVSGTTATSLRREPDLEPTPSLGPVAPRDAQRARAAAAVPLDPAEQRISDMTAALGDQATDRDRRPDQWRAAVHHPPKKRRSHGWLVWLIVLAVIGVGVWYAWSIGLLDAYIRQLNLAVPTRYPAG